MAPTADIPDEPRVDFSLFGGAESLAEGKKVWQGGSPVPRRTVVVSPDEKSEGLYGAPQDPSDFLWIMTEEPHRTRRKEIMKAHPEVFKLMGYEPLTKYVVLSVVLLQFTVAYFLRHTSIFDWKFLLAAYVIGGTANHNLFLAVHEITHNLAFKGIKANKMLAIVANLPIGVPYAITFKGYHLEHHKYMGEDGVDVDLPTNLELICLNNVLGKVFFCTFQILFYALRPGFVRSQKPTSWHFIGIAIQALVDIVLLNFVPGGRNMLAYLIMSSFWAGSLHPLAGHFIAEHYVWDGLEQETYSYYGWLNIFAYNVGYHNEHHDFPSVPWTRLPALRKLAPEFYDTLPSHPSWPMIIVNFIRDPNVGIFARVKREPRASKKAAPPAVELDGGCADVPVEEGAGVVGVSGVSASPSASDSEGETRRRK